MRLSMKIAMVAANTTGAVSTLPAILPLTSTRRVFRSSVMGIPKNVTANSVDLGGAGVRARKQQPSSALPCGPASASAARR